MNFGDPFSRVIFMRLSETSQSIIEDALSRSNDHYGIYDEQALWIKRADDEEGAIYISEMYYDPKR